MILNEFLRKSCLPCWAMCENDASYGEREESVGFRIKKVVDGSGSRIITFSIPRGVNFIKVSLVSAVTSNRVYIQDDEPRIMRALTVGGCDVIDVSATRSVRVGLPVYHNIVIEELK